ncbi:TPA: regulatory protein GemA [Serratia marcescens]|uniref:Regulatory protein GemA n=1 Tax=Serratia marcescens TaxID=615 RepID=A0AB33FVJ9_SERMA|nr:MULTISPECIES: regulatory protein GemA [Serratia]AKL43325.1 hypothetical protein AB188_23565 [Serratia marcescens]AWL70677.1 regulatory protein GemA [Serratia marcescens]MCX2172124.1 regulatory protein GemA [Serratia marcescens]MCX2178004.1 regulatory protein GemA [Serratia marcescens]MDP8603923.1 regulatory protein GemA [Serratia marcescens]
MATKAHLIKLIHVARRKLQLDEETYRSLLACAVPGKNSCRDMSLPELEKVLSDFKSKGFKPTSTSAKSQAKGAPGVTDKIRAIWHTMHREGFIQHDTAEAINGYVKRITHNSNGGVGIARLDWLRGSDATVVLESLKRWHRRCMVEAMALSDPPRGYDAVCRQYRQQRRQ